MQYRTLTVLNMCSDKILGVRLIYISKPYSSMNLRLKFIINNIPT